MSPSWSYSSESLSSPLSDASGTIYLPSEEENSSIWLYYILGFAEFFLWSFLLTAPAPFLLLLLSLLTVLDFDQVFDVNDISDANSPSEEETSSVWLDTGLDFVDFSYYLSYS